jgi:hypothetical protein
MESNVLWSLLHCDTTKIHDWSGFTDEQVLEQIDLMEGAVKMQSYSPSSPLPQPADSSGMLSVTPFNLVPKLTTSTNTGKKPAVHAVSSTYSLRSVSTSVKKRGCVRIIDHWLDGATGAQDLAKWFQEKNFEVKVNFSNTQLSNSCGWVAAYTAAKLYDSNDGWWDANVEMSPAAWKKILQQGNAFLGLSRAGASTRFLSGDECLELGKKYSKMQKQEEDCFMNGPGTIPWFKAALQKWMDRVFNENPQDVDHASKMFVKLYFNTSIFILNTDSTGDGLHWFIVAVKLNPDYY